MQQVVQKIDCQLSMGDLSAARVWQSFNMRSCDIFFFCFLYSICFVCANITQTSHALLPPYIEAVAFSRAYTATLDKRGVRDSGVFAFTQKNNNNNNLLHQCFPSYSLYQISICRKQNSAST